MPKKYKLIIISLLFFLIISIGIFVYEQYNLSKTQEAISTSIKYQETAKDYSLKAEEYENKNEYANGIIMRQKSLNELSNAMNTQLDASLATDGVYKDYIENDILLLKTMHKLLSIQIQFDRQKNGESVADYGDYNNLDSQMNKLKDEILSYQNKKAELVSKNKDVFKFLN